MIPFFKLFFAFLKRIRSTEAATTVTITTKITKEKVIQLIKTHLILQRKRCLKSLSRSKTEAKRMPKRCAQCSCKPTKKKGNCKRKSEESERNETTRKYLKFSLSKKKKTKITSPLLRIYCKLIHVIRYGCTKTTKESNKAHLSRSRWINGRSILPIMMCRIPKKYIGSSTKILCCTSNDIQRLSRNFLMSHKCRRTSNSRLSLCIRINNSSNTSNNNYQLRSTKVE